MGRHSTGSDLAFYRSLAAGLLPWFLIAGLAVGAVWLTVGALGGRELATSPPDDEIPVVDPSPSASPTPEDTPTPRESPSPRKTRKPPPKSPTPPPLITEGVSVQVLNGTGVPDANDRVADRLDALGYTIVNLEGANRAYSVTTVFWSYPEAEAAARSLAEHFGWVAGPRPSNLSTQVDLHVVVGADEA